MLAHVDELARQGHVRRRSTDHSLADLAMRVPQVILRDMWALGAKDALIKCQEAERQERDVFLHFHACWYQREFNDFALLASPLLIEELGAECIITVIDDIYDVAEHLYQDAHLVMRPDIRNGSPAEFIEKVADNCSLLLRWRASELVASEALSRSTDRKRHYVVAAKHPLSTLYWLIYEPNRGMVYLSHPITTPRGMLFKGAESQDGAKAFMDTVNAIGESLGRNVTAFLPTMIDEARFILTEDKKHYQYHMHPRWPLTTRHENAFWSPPPGRTQPVSNPLEPAFSLLRDSPDVYREDRALAEHYISLLAKQVGGQVSSRDRILVEQSSGLAVWRPVYRGHESGGVQNEMEHFGTLASCRSSEDRLPYACVIAHLAQDTAAFHETHVSNRLRQEIKEGRIAFDDSRMCDKFVQHVSSETFLNDPIFRSAASSGSTLRDAILQHHGIVRGDKPSILSSQVPAQQLINYTSAVEEDLLELAKKEPVVVADFLKDTEKNPPSFRVILVDHEDPEGFVDKVLQAVRQHANEPT